MGICKRVSIKHVADGSKEHGYVYIVSSFVITAMGNSTNTEFDHTRLNLENCVEFDQREIRRTVVEALIRVPQRQNKKLVGKLHA